MKFIECPHCQNQAVKLWYLFIFPSPLWISWLCNNCRKKIKLNRYFIKFWFCSIAAGMVIGISIEELGFNIPDIIGSLMGIIVFLLPAILGIPLFLKKEAK